ncbi:MAG: hypothetical protein LBI10_02520, partial [Deltaproteobacteria bacterium]|nr:hypothetical protein [Deltaproteobacteria bacterium]
MIINPAKKRLKDLIGKFFREFNIIEYKSPLDVFNFKEYLLCTSRVSIFLHTKPHDAIKNTTLTFFLSHFPREVMETLELDGLTLVRKGPIIYSGSGFHYPIQFVLTDKLTDKEELYFGLLRKGAPTDKIKKLAADIIEIGAPQDFYLNCLDVIEKANPKNFEEAFDQMPELVKLIDNTSILQRIKQRSKEEGREEG